MCAKWMNKRCLDKNCIHKHPGGKGTAKGRWCCLFVGGVFFMMQYADVGNSNYPASCHYLSGSMGYEKREREGREGV